jgi:hypothetical protein
MAAKPEFAYLLDNRKIFENQKLSRFGKNTDAGIVQTATEILEPSKARPFSWGRRLG